MGPVEILKKKAAFLRESLQKSQTNTDKIVAIFETSMRPTQVRTHAIRRAHENIDKTIKYADFILKQQTARGPDITLRKFD